VRRDLLKELRKLCAVTTSPISDESQIPQNIDQGMTPAFKAGIRDLSEGADDCPGRTGGHHNMIVRVV